MRSCRASTNAAINPVIRFNGGNPIAVCGKCGRKMYPSKSVLQQIGPVKKNRASH